jgi:hypothetical protein
VTPLFAEASANSWIQWPPTLADIVAFGAVVAAVGSAVTNMVHSRWARARMFRDQKKDRKKLNQLYGLAKIHGWIEDKVSTTSVWGDDDEDDEDEGGET